MTEIVTNPPLFVVGIGASLSGIEALRIFFEKMPAGSDLAFVVVLHLAAGRKSLLPEILARWTAMPVSEARDGDAVVAGQVHVIPGGVVARLSDGRLTLRQIPPDAPRDITPIDGFFDSLASGLNDRAIGVILSGTGHDGALGLKAIKGRGGLTLTQGSNSSKPEYSSMPASAVAMGVVDFHGPIEEMPAHIVAARTLQMDDARREEGLVADAGAEAVRLELRSALRRCMETGRPVEQQRAVFGPDGTKAPPVRLIVEPLPDSGSDALNMIVFLKADPARPAGDRTHDLPIPVADAALMQLERENRDLREQLQSIAEEHTAAARELHHSNEELLSVNEKLNTINGQLTAKLEQLDRSNGDLKNLFDSTKVATVFLDPFMIIRCFTPELATIYHLVSGDIGRPLTDIVSRVNYATLREDVRIVLRTLEPMEKRIERQDGSAHYLMRILPYRGSDSAIDGSLITFSDVTSIARQEQHQRLLVDELNHRVKNMLTVVISLATNTLRQAPSLEAFHEVFLGRIHALTAAYALLNNDGWSPIPVRAILTEELKPFLSDERTNIAMTGPPVTLSPRTALAFGMAVHELTTNAAKYGALSVPDGNVGIVWSIETAGNDEVLVLTWTERNGPPVSAPGRRGFGSALIERVFAHDARGQAKIGFAPSGVVATLRAPLSGNT